MNILAKGPNLYRRLEQKGLSVEGAVEDYTALNTVLEQKARLDIEQKALACWKLH